MGTRIRKSPDRMFELFCEIGIPSSSTESAWVGWKYPSSYKDEETLKTVPEFAYPVEFIDFLPWHETFYRVLNQAAELSCRGKSCSSPDLRSFLEALYKHAVPDPGLELHVHYGSNKEFVASCPDHSKLPSIPENRNMTEYFNAVDAHNMMTIFASMLHERRILIMSKKLSRLSACVQAANALIYPMHWQHIFIPVLPKHLLDYLNAPMPFLIGVPASTFSRMKLSDIGDVVILDADNNKVDSPYADLDALPSEVLQSLRHDLKRPQEMLGDCVARAFLKASVKLIGGYWNALKLKPGEKISFSPELFVQTRPAPMQPFLEKMLQLQIFQQFIESRLKMLNSGQGVSDEFEFELSAHEDKANTGFRNQYRDWVYNMKKEGGAFFKNVRLKVKDTGKKAYKDIRSRLHDMHHHKIVEDEATTRTYRKRGSSVPSLFVNGIDVTHNSEKKKDASSGEQIKESNKHLSPGELKNASDSTGKKSPVPDSPALTFKPIDVDLMSDLQELIFRRCSLCTDRIQQRTSISDPQLIDLSCEEPEEKCSPNCHSKLSSSHQVSEEQPPPLLPRPPPGKQHVKNKLYSSRNMQSGSKVSEKPLIELDSEDCSKYSGMDHEILTRGEDSISRGLSNSLASFSLTASPVPNNFSNSLLVSEKPELTNPSVFSATRSTNPFSPTSEMFGSNASSGPSVRGMIDMWQSYSVVSSATTHNACKSAAAADTSKSVPYRSQSLLRTVSTPPPSTSPVPGMSSSGGLSSNPFLAPGLSHVISEGNSSDKRYTSNIRNASSSWENFQ